MLLRLRRSSAGPSSLLAARQWLNTLPLRADELRGKVVLVNFWTYSCINSLRALPYVRAWADKYRDRGLVTVGVHTPEFSFEKDIANVEQAVNWYDVRYPVVTDNQYAIWNSFRNQGWPGFYLVGADGRVRYRALGEGEYDTSERVIQQLLSEAAGAAVTDTIAAVPGQGVEAQPIQGICARQRLTSVTPRRAISPRPAESRKMLRAHIPPHRRCRSITGGWWACGRSRANLRR